MIGIHRAMGTAVEGKSEIRDKNRRKRQSAGWCDRSFKGAKSEEARKKKMQKTMTEEHGGGDQGAAGNTQGRQ